MSKKTTRAFIATFFSIMGFIIYLLAWKKDKYTKFYAKQSLVVFIFAVIGSAVSTIVGWIPVIGGLIAAGVNLLVILSWIYSWSYALSGKQKEVPVIGEYAKKIDL
jgi:uncharacterized membrane protein